MCKDCLGITPDDPRFAQLDELITANQAVKGALIPVLHGAQELFGFLPEEVLRHVAKGLSLPESEVYGVVTFYNLFSTEPVGRYPISLCMGTACYVRGAGRILEELETELGIKAGEVTPDGLFSLEVCRCLGACAFAPVLTVGGETHGKMTDRGVRQLLATLRQKASAEAVPAGR